MADTLARRDYNEVNTNYQAPTIPQAQPQTVTVTVTKYIKDNNVNYSTQEPAYTTVQEQPVYSTSPAPVYTSVPASAPSWQYEMLNQVNAVRSKVGKAPLQLNNGLNTMAQGQSDYQSQIRKMTHANSAGSLGQRCTQVGLKWRGVAENVAYNYKDVTAVVQGWVNSQGHYANMIGNYNAVGFGENNLYWTQDFALI
ncbi:hypothetical protein BX661DRAFT_198852 [Kickxella alabastrina]|uniref:uncharacterized protein n=1 Tax=Kickxella alabastrina TaxID=61397 RepID=UPI00221EE906|nr:uncharacterized protein BX661DRAFT_198852 [Kickxella alabastrina]KAI7826837.1 hypothetical protein BX661DRAFT_198852 [Kickxella alabastrina]